MRRICLLLAAAWALSGCSAYLEERPLVESLDRMLHEMAGRGQEGAKVAGLLGQCPTIKDLRRMASTDSIACRRAVIFLEFLVTAGYKPGRGFDPSPDGFELDFPPSVLCLYEGSGGAGGITNWELLITEISNLGFRGVARSLRTARDDRRAPGVVWADAPFQSLHDRLRRVGSLDCESWDGTRVSVVLSQAGAETRVYVGFNPREIDNGFLDVARDIVAVAEPFKPLFPDIDDH